MGYLQDKVYKMQEDINNLIWKDEDISNKLLNKFNKLKNKCLNKNRMSLNEKYLNIIETTNYISNIEDDKKLQKLIATYTEEHSFINFKEVIFRRNYLANKFGYENYFLLYKCKLNLENIDSELLQEIDNLIKEYIVSMAQQIYKKNLQINGNTEINIQKLISDFSVEIYNLYSQVKDIRYKKDYGGALTYYMPSSDRFKIEVKYLSDVDKVEYLIHELGHIYEIYNMEKDDRRQYKVFFNKEVCECVPCMLEGSFLKFIHDNNVEMFKNMFIWVEDIVTLIPFLNVKFLFEKYVYINIDKITELDLEKYWNDLILQYMPHQINNEEFHWLKNFIVDDLPFNSFKYLLGRIVSLLTLGSEEDFKDVYNKYFQFGFKFSSYFKCNRKNINNIDKYVNI